LSDPREAREGAVAEAPVAGPSFAELYGRPPQTAADAPGRVNLIGEHTDYNGGFVLPLAIPQRTRVELAPRRDGRVRAWSANLKEPRSEEYALGGEARGRRWLDYVQGVTAALAAAGHAIPGCDLRIESEVPLGAGLSSSAALEVAVLRALRQAFDLAISDVEIARLGQRAENDLVGAPVGIMDQMAASLADERRALFLDTRSLHYERVPLPPAAGIAVIDSAVPHHNVASEYRTRREECERAAALLGVPQLRDLDYHDLWRLAALPDPLDCRARHVITENARVRAAVTAMQSGDLERLGQLFVASHESLRDDYEVSVPEVDRLVDIARAEPGVYGARMTGGGFGGAVVVLCAAGRAREAGDRITAEYRRQTGRPGRRLVPME